LKSFIIEFAEFEGLKALPAKRKRKDEGTDKTMILQHLDSDYRDLHFINSLASTCSLQPNAAREVFPR